MPEEDRGEDERCERDRRDDELFRCELDGDLLRGRRFARGSGTLGRRQGLVDGGERGQELLLVW